MEDQWLRSPYGRVIGLFQCLPRRHLGWTDAFERIVAAREPQLLELPKRFAPVQVFHELLELRGLELGQVFRG
jgi:hypothetical protein